MVKRETDDFDFQFEDSKPQRVKSAKKRKSKKKISESEEEEDAPLFDEDDVIITTGSPLIVRQKWSKRKPSYERTFSIFFVYLFL